MTKINDGGPAYPQNKLCPPVIGGFPMFEQIGGLSIRDTFAIAALQGLLANPDWNRSLRDCVIDAFDAADIAIAERGKTNA